MKEWLSWFPDQLQVLIMAGLPFIELRGAIPVATLIGLPYHQALICGIVGNLLPIIPLLYFFDPLMVWISSKSPRYRRLFQRMQEKAGSKGGSIRKYGAAMGLFLFVLVPVPGSGAYTACFAASFFRVPFWTSAISISAGTIGSGLLFATLSHYLAFWIGWM